MKTKEEYLDEVAIAEGYNNGVDLVCVQGAIDPVYLAMDQYAQEYGQQQAIAFAMWLQRTNPTGLISTLYVKFIEHQNQKPTNE